MKKTVLITGGHLTPALAVIDRLIVRHPDWSLHFVGRSHAFTYGDGDSAEATETKKRDIPFYPLSAGRITRKVSFGLITNLLRIPYGFIQSITIIRKLRPDVILTFGGYVGLPIAVVGRLYHIPVCIHEQTRIPGLANRIIRLCGGKLYTSFPDVTPGATCIGLPLQTVFYSPPDETTLVIPKKPFIFISGGSTGALSMNIALYPIIRVLLKSMNVIHQTGSVSSDTAKVFWSTLPKALQTAYTPVTSVTASDMAWLMHHATCFVGRAGANTVIETVVSNIPSMFIPLPWSSGQEQYWNARFVSDAGGAYIIKQSDLDETAFIQVIEQVKTNESAMRRALEVLSTTIPSDASDRMVDSLEGILSSP